MKKLISILLLSFTFGFSQTEKKIDSLESVIRKSKDLEELNECYVKLLTITVDHDLNKTRSILNRFHALSKEKKCATCDMMANFYEGHYYDRLGKTEKSIFYFDKSAQIALKIKDYYQFQRSNSWKIQVLLSNRSDYSSIENEFKKYDSIAKKYNIKEGWHEIYFLQAMHNYNKGYLKKSIEYYIKADKSANIKNNDLVNFRLAVLNNIAQVYKELRDYPKTMQYVNEAKQYAIRSKDSFNIMNIVLHKGVIQTDFKNYEKGLPFLIESFNYYNKINNTHYKSSSALYLSIANFHLNRLIDAKKYNAIAENIYQSESSALYLAETLAYKTLISLGLNDMTTAKSAIDEANEIFKDHQADPSYPKFLTSEIAYAIKMKAFEKALELTKKKDSLENIIQKNSNTNQINELEAIYQNEQKIKEIELLKAKNEVTEKQNYIYIAITGILMLSGIFLFYAYRNKIKTAQKLNELNELKSRFFANISHEFRTPLTLIKSPVQSLQAEISNESQKRKLDLIDKNSNRMLDLVDQLLELSKLDSGNLKLILKEGNIGLFLHSIVESFAFQAKENKLSFSSSIEKNTENHHFDKDVIEKIVSNLLSNALKYTPENESIHFQSTIINNELQLIVSNSGSEMKKEELSKIFERFYQKKENHQGVGIGLALVKELVELYKGKISTTVEKGILSFSVCLPLEKSHQIAFIVPKETPNSITNEIINESELPILLLVDDNENIRTVLKDLFKQNFHILEAEDGVQALKMAKKEVPDCIISDVMMPKMDGFEFTKQIKNHELTSFIPVILLTAKTSDEAHLESLKSTADAFLTKPFNNDIVKATVFQLIEERKKLQRRYRQELILKPVDIVINSVDEQFMKKLQQILDHQLSNADYTAEDFASDIGMSRMQLHRKLKSLLGVSATEFMRNERLKNAAELLIKGNGNISEIAYTVGFNDVSYFSKCFKEYFNCTPTDYIEKSKKS